VPKQLYISLNHILLGNIFLTASENQCKPLKEELSQKQLSEVTEELIPKTQRLANINWYLYFLKQWVIFAAIIFVSGIVLIIFFVSLGFPFLRTIELTTLNNSALSSIVGPSITVIGFVMAFSPVISLFYFSELREYRNNIYEIVDGILSPLRQSNCIDREKERELSKKMFEHFFNLFTNKMYSILKYLAAFIIISFAFFPILIILFITLSNGVFLILDICLMLSLMAGVIPILLDAVGRSSLKIKNPYTIV
jgi:hypothetical protein